MTVFLLIDRLDLQYSTTMKLCNNESNKFVSFYLSRTSQQVYMVCFLLWYIFYNLFVLLLIIFFQILWTILPESVKGNHLIFFFLLQL